MLMSGRARNVENPTKQMAIPTGVVLCQASNTSPPAEFKSLYPFVTTVQGNRFRFRGGDPGQLSGNLERLFASRLGQKVRVQVEK